ncbi:MAG: peptide chain release factor 2 [Pelagibacteraceae bacterium TMED65]|nr:peptide chain release factor 2 [Rickettsiales bacterium]OUU51634.1 MAG: peptide chain release factor 2 [Pelagibacteraceae bacterium TMED65]
MFEKKQILKEINLIEERIQNQENWNNHEMMNQDLKKKNYLVKFVELINTNKENFEDTLELLLISDKEGDKSLFDDLKKELLKIEKNLSDLYLETLMSGKADSNNSLIEIHSGAGGVESQDWVAMLLRMYSRWCDSKGYKTELVDQNIGDEAGYKSVTFKVIGENSYGWLKYENGVHRLVRISPFDSQSRRHTSFASVFCYPEVNNNIQIELNEKDLKVDTFRASGAGGQHVNKTDSAIRITHLPSKIIVQCQSSRSQHRNKSIALDMLKSKIYEKQLIKEEEENKKSRLERGEIGWGNQIRSYIMQPYTMVKDHRTNKQISDVNSVLDGRLDIFLENQLVKFS